MTRTRLLLGLTACIALCATSAMAASVGTKDAAHAPRLNGLYTSHDCMLGVSALTVKQNGNGYLVGDAMQSAFMLEPASWKADRDGHTYQARFDSTMLHNAHFAVLGTHAYGLTNADRAPELMAALKRIGWVDPL